MSEFYVEDIFPVSFRATPFLLGRAVGVFSIGQQVELRKESGAVYSGSLETIEIHRPSPDKVVLAFSESISSKVEPGDVIVSVQESQER